MQRAKAVEGAVGTTTVANMMNWDHMRVFFRRTAALAAFVALLWAIQVVNWITGYGLNPAFGLIPRHGSGLDGVIAMPLLHGSFSHLMANTPPLLVMGGLLVATTTRGLLSVNAVVIGLGGGLVWLFGGSAIHIGAAIAKELSIPTVIIPPNPGVTSALGCLLVDIQHDFSDSFMAAAADTKLCQCFANG